ncbi:MAG: A/G-specific adenine glycosylase, partial [Bacteroidales bacterium]|nr:A/G-specific adenine glycosylase [Bacteroidales bacterium]
MVGLKLINWYELNKRNLPWRDTSNPYLIWVSEIILQQTRVNQGLGYYYRFIEKFPDIFALAEAKIDDVLKVWQG